MSTKIVSKFEPDWSSRFGEIVLTDFENTVLRKTRLKFQKTLTLSKNFFFFTYMESSIPAP